MTISPPQVAVYVWLNYDFRKSGIARQNYMKYLNSKNIASIIVNKCYINAIYLLIITKFRGIWAILCKKNHTFA